MDTGRQGLGCGYVESARDGREICFTFVMGFAVFAPYTCARASKTQECDGLADILGRSKGVHRLGCVVSCRVCAAADRWSVTGGIPVVSHQQQGDRI